MKYKLAASVFFLIASVSAGWRTMHDPLIGTNAVKSTNFVNEATNAINLNSIPNLMFDSNVSLDIPCRLMADGSLTVDSGELRVNYFTAPFTRTYTNIGVLVTTAYSDVGNAATNVVVAIYGLSNDNRSLSNLITATATNTNWLGVTGYRTNGFTNAFNAVAGVRYGIAFLFFGSTLTVTNPAISANSTVAALAALPPIICSLKTGVSVLPAAQAMTSTTGTYIWYRLE